MILETLGECSHKQLKVTDFKFPLFTLLCQSLMHKTQTNFWKILSLSMCNVLWHFLAYCSQYRFLRILNNPRNVSYNAQCERHQKKTIQMLPNFVNQPKNVNYNWNHTLVFCHLNFKVVTLIFRVPWTARRSNQSILKEISPEYSLEGPMLKLQYFGHLMPRTDSLEKTLMLGKIEGGRRRGQQRMRWLDGITD